METYDHDLVHEAVLLRCSIYRKKGNLDSAVSDIQSAISMKPHYVPAYLTLAEIQYARNMFGKAEVALHLATLLNPLDKDLMGYRLRPCWPDELSFETVVTTDMSRNIDEEQVLFERERLKGTIDSHDFLRNIYDGDFAELQKNWRRDFVGFRPVMEV